MKVKKISYIEDIPDDLVSAALDIFVTLEDSSGKEFLYLVDVTTTQFLVRMMEKDESKFLEPEYPAIIVSKLTNDIIKTAMQAYVDGDDDCYWLKLYDLIPKLKIEEINEILNRKEKEELELEAKREADIELEEKLDALDAKLDALQAKMDALETKIDG